MDDVHLADPASLQPTGYTARGVTRLPVLIVLTRRSLPRRPELDALEHHVRARGALLGQLTLGPLGDEELGQLVRELADLPDGSVTEVVGAAGGNPLLAVERARALAQGEQEPPESLRAAVRAPLVRLGGRKS
jgi:hypothetical protein